MALDRNDLLKNLPIGDLAQQFGVSDSVMSGAVQKAVPGLLAGLAVNASSSEGAEKLAEATKKHSQKAASISDIDIEDGKKIVAKILGSKEKDVVSALEKDAGDSQQAALIGNVMPFLAPLIMQFLAGGQKSGGGVTDLLGGLLGGGSKSSGGGVADLVGGLLGAGSGGGMTDIIGGLLGGSSSKKDQGGLGGIVGGLLGK